MPSRRAGRTARSPPGEPLRAESTLTTLHFPPGRYDFYPDQAFERSCWISNHDSGRRRIGIPLIDCHDVTIAAEGARFVFHGCMIPVWIGNSQNIEWQGGAIDWAMPFDAQAVITRKLRHGFELRVNMGRRL